MATKKVGKSKLWFKVHAPKIFNENEIGEVLAIEGQNLIGRKINSALSEVIGDLTRSNVKLTFKINKVEGEHAFTEFTNLEISKPFLMRMIRHRISKIDYVTDFTLADNIKVRLKSLIITAHKANSGQKTALRKMLKEELTKTVPTMDLNALVVAIATSKIQKEVGKNLIKVYPIRFLEIRKLVIIKEKRKG